MILIIALYAIVGKFHYSSPQRSTSENESIIALYAIVGEFHYPSPYRSASGNKFIALYAIVGKFTIHLLS